jgi:alkylated DNA repair protein (DNA oxidative demethylase)
MTDLLAPPASDREWIRDGMVLLRRFADTASLLPLILEVAAVAPFRHMRTPGGQAMSVAMTNCGALGWVSDRAGYRYTAVDPDSGVPWPPLPEAFRALAVDAAAAAGWPGFAPDACLVNRYAVGSRLTAHQDRNESDFAHPIVSVSLGLTATFFVSVGDGRSGPTRSVALVDGDVVVWGGPARLAHHGVRDLKAGDHPLTGPRRYNLTLRRAG